MFVPIPILVAGVAALLVLALLAVRRGGGGRGDLLRAPTPLSLPPETEVEVRALLENGGKIAAIKLVRASSGAGLKEAKDLVERIQAEW
jgi:ribosomal protein L7/L12